MKRRFLEDIDLITVHCSATPYRNDVIGVEEIREMHLKRGFDDIGYNYVIRTNGLVEQGRPLEYVPAHAKGFNQRSIGICMVGGVETRVVDGEEELVPVDNFAEIQKMSLKQLINSLSATFPQIVYLCGHRDLSKDANGDGIIDEWEWSKYCPCFEAWSWYISVANPGHPAKWLKAFDSTLAHG